MQILKNLNLNVLYVYFKVCGVPNTVDDEKQRIVGGQKSGIGEHPWQVYTIHNILIFNK